MQEPGCCAMSAPVENLGQKSESKNEHKGPMKNFRDGVREHIVPINNLVLITGSLISLCDFLSPLLSGFNRAFYTVTTGLALLLILAAIFPKPVDRVLAALGYHAQRTDLIPIWKRPAWQIIVVALLLISGLGLASVAKASEGGWIASHFHSAKNVQASLLGLERDVAGIKKGMEDANSKLDILVGDSQDPQKDVVARGYTYDGGGLAKAIEQSDAVAVALFTKAKLKVTSHYPMWRILTGQQTWNNDIISTLDPSMFEIAEACKPNVEWAHPPKNERIAQYKRLCPIDIPLERIERIIKSIEAMPKPLYQRDAEELARDKEALALLQK